MITVGAFTRKIKPGLRLPLAASGGVAPYSWAVNPDGAGGSVNSSGIYTAPNSIGVDVVTVTDDNGDTAEFTINILEPIQLLADIIKEEMELSDDQVYIYNQKLTLPPDSRTYIAVGVFYAKPYGSSVKEESTVSGLDEVKSVNMMVACKVNIMSRNTDALFRKEEIATALKSTYSKKQQIFNAFMVAQMPEQYQDLSEIEGSAIPYRFETTVKIQYSDVKRKSIDYYDDFPDVSVTTEA